jgi:hypothetical protein
MTDLDAAIFSRLSTFAPLVALVPVTHIAAVTIAQGILTPYVVYQTIDDIPDYAHDGLVTLRHPRIQVSSYASSIGAAKAINTQVVAALTTWPAANAEIQSVMIENVIPLYDSATGLFDMITDFIIQYTA